MPVYYKAMSDGRRLSHEATTAPTLRYFGYVSDSWGGYMLQTEENLCTTSGFAYSTDRTSSDLSESGATSQYPWDYWDGSSWVADYTFAASCVVPTAAPTASPTAAPTGTPTPAPTPPAYTDGSYTVRFYGGSFDSECSWDVDGGETLSSDTNLDALTLSLAPGDHTVNMFDSFGDGWNGAYVTLLNTDGTEVAGPFTFTSGSNSTETFSLDTAAPTVSPTAAPSWFV
jgi:hypothetical protein